jgi:nucleoside-diphosphate-sugar epimerase
VVVDMLSVTERDAVNAVLTFRGVARRVVVISSQDVYLPWGYILGIEPAPVDALVTESSPLRQSRYPHRGKRFPAFRDWDFENYEKILVEKVYQADPSLPPTILRLPMVYGPGDYFYRTFTWARRMQDRRAIIPVAASLARWQGPMSYVEDVAEAISLAVNNNVAAGRIYNVAEAEIRSTEQFIRDIGQAMGWDGRVVGLPDDTLPGPWQGYNLDQDLITDSSAIRRDLGFAERSRGPSVLRETAEWELTHPPKPLPGEMFDYPAEDAALASVGLTAASNMG